MSVVRFSTAFRDHRASGGSLQSALQNGSIIGYSGPQPTSADSAPTGATKLIEFTAGSAAKTSEVCASGSVTLTDGASGSVNSITVDSVELLAANRFGSAVPVAFNSSLTQTAADVAAQINLGTWHHRYRATSSGAVISIYALPGMGDVPNGYVVASTCTTITTTDANLSGGVDPANGLQFGATSSGAIVKSGVWSGVGIAAGTVTWVRFIGSIADAQGESTTQIRMDMDAATAAAFFEMSSTAIAVGATVTIDSATFTEQSVVTA